MTDDAHPVVVAFDGSEPAKAAVRTAAELFPGRRIVVVSVWEPGLAIAMAPTRDITGVGYAPPSVDEIATIDRLQRDRAAEVAREGADLARALGGVAEPYPVADEVDVADTIVSIADACDACAVVVGSRGLRGVKSRLYGSTSTHLLHHTGRPVLVVKARG
jgi:nucleotide-binding universal stress UspA family protein